MHSVRSLVTWVGTTRGRLDLSTLLLALLVLALSLTLAYLTNPSESSFRTYLTEQSFRHHLSRLDYNLDEDHPPRPVNYPNNPSIGAAKELTCRNKFNPFHFANRASVSLQTPRHIFRTLGICSIVAVTTSGTDHGCDQHRLNVLDTWFFGAFGRWWRGGKIAAWHLDSLMRSKSEEGWKSGLVSFKATDKSVSPNGSTLEMDVPIKAMPEGRSAPKLRNRRSSTPPLPESASLPLHTARLLPSPPHTPTSRNSGLPSPHGNAAPRSVPTAHQVLAETPAEVSPAVLELQQQIASAKGGVEDLKTQLAEIHASAAQSRASLQAEVDELREHKREEDVIRVKLKARIKTLEDSKRHAEGRKREVEKRLASSKATHTEYTRSLAKTASEISCLQERSVSDDILIKRIHEETLEAEKVINETLRLQRHEIQVGEEVIANLNARHKSLEESLAAEKLRLLSIQQQIENGKADRAAYPPYVVAPDFQSWSAVTEYQDDLSVRPRPIRLSLGASDHDLGRENIRLAFSPFDGEESLPPVPPPGTPSYLSTGIMNMMDSSDSLSRSFQSETDTFLEVDWRKDVKTSPPTEMLSESPRSIEGGPFGEHDPFEIRMPARDQALGMQRAMMPKIRAHSDPSTVFEIDNIAPERGPRRWFTNSAQNPFPRGLNPAAKIFKLGDSSTRQGPAAISGVTYDALNPHGVGSATSNSLNSSTSRSLLRAFEPSPAEREVLRRALGGSSNASLELLPSLGLSDVVDSEQEQTSGQVMFGRSLPAWLQSLPRRKPTTNFSPWDDSEEVAK